MYLSTHVPVVRAIVAHPNLVNVQSRPEKYKYEEAIKYQHKHKKYHIIAYPS